MGATFPWQGSYDMTWKMSPSRPSSSPPLSHPAGGHGARAELRRDPHAEDLVRRVETALCRFGAAGEVRVKDGDVLLQVQGESLRTSLGGWLDNWATLDVSTKDRVATDLARKLRESRRPAAAPPPPRRLLLDRRLLSVAILVGGLFSYLWFSTSRQEGRAAGSSIRTDADSNAAAVRVTGFAQATPGRAAQDHGAEHDLRAGRASRTCAQTLRRVLQGGTVSPLDAEGWRVELALLRSNSSAPLHQDPTLREFVQVPEDPQGSQLAYAPVGDLRALDTPDSVVLVLGTPLSGGEQPPIPGITLRFSGTYVDSYFDTNARGKFHELAHALRTALSATHGALYARCFDSRVHTLGTWFFGLDTPQATTSLLYFIGTYAHPPHLEARFLPPANHADLGRKHTFLGIAHAARHLDRAALSTLVGSEGGLALGEAGRGVTIAFPFADGNRASRVSRTAARVLGLSD